LRGETAHGLRSQNLYGCLLAGYGFPTVSLNRSVAARSNLPRSGFGQRVARDFRLVYFFGTVTQETNKSAPEPGWLQIVLIGRRPKYTLIRILVLVSVVALTTKFVLLPIRVEGISMEPTYRNHKIDCVNRLAYLLHQPMRGDVVAIRFSEPDSLATPKELLMKRIIGLPGENVAFHEGRVYINGHLLDEPYLKSTCDWEHAPILCGPGQYYVVGDNRTMPFEYHVQGRADRDRIIGKVLL
jgi:signal peptidase I